MECSENKKTKHIKNKKKRKKTTQEEHENRKLKTSFI